MNQVIITAEVGINHSISHKASVDEAVRLIDASKRAGADLVKFQAWHENRFPDLENIRLTYDQLSDLHAYAKTQGIGWFCTPFDVESIRFLRDEGVDVWKIPSGLITNKGYLGYIADTINGESVVLSTGMCVQDEVKDAINILFNDSMKEINERLIVLHCTTVYPTPYDEVNLKAMVGYYGSRYGLSDHTDGIEVAIAAVALGASMIEKHITLDSNAKGPDHKASIEPDEFHRMVNSIRNVEAALGDGVKRPSPTEMINRDAIREKMGEG